MVENEELEEITLRYTSKMAADDGILSYSKDEGIKDDTINLITTNLLNLLKETETDIPKIYELARKTMKQKGYDVFYSFSVVLKGGKSQLIFIGLNDFSTKKKSHYTMMKKEDY